MPQVPTSRAALDLHQTRNTTVPMQGSAASLHVRKLALARAIAQLFTGRTRRHLSRDIRDHGAPASLLAVASVRETFGSIVGDAADMSKTWSPEVPDLHSEASMRSTAPE